MDAVINAALPIFGLIGVGYLSARMGGFDPAATASLNRFAFYLALPALIFVAMTKVTPAQLGEVGFVVAFGSSIAVLFALGFAVRRLAGKRLANASIGGLAAGYGNVGFMGIPLCLLVFGNESLPAAVIATLFTGCILFLVAIALIEIDLHKGRGVWQTLCNVGGPLVLNPLLVSPVAGLMIGLSGLTLPTPVERFATLLGGAASPCALFCVGLFLAQERMGRGAVSTIAVLVGLKLVVHPALTAALVYGAFSMPPVWAKAAVLLSALPIGSGPFTIAKLYNLDPDVMSGAILISHLFSVLTVTALIGWLG